MILGYMMKFPLGNLSITRGALTSIPAEDIYRALDNHVCGKWGEVSAEAHAENESALLGSAPLLSVFRTSNGSEFRVLTFGNRSQTIVHLPSDSILKR